MDRALLRAINALRTPWLDGVAKFLGTWGYYAVPVLLLVALAVQRRRVAATVRDGILAWFAALLVAEDIVKPLVGRPRPTADAALRGTLRVLGRVPPASSLGFPSGTAAAVFAGATWAWIKWGPRAGVPCVLAATVVGLSRVYMGVHWPSDVVGGAAVGAALAFGVDRFSRWAGEAR